MATPIGAHTPASSLPPQGASPPPHPARFALTIPEDRAEFDREYQRALATAADTMELTASTRCWCSGVAWLTHDHGAYQRMMDRADRLRRCKDVPACR